MSSSLEQLSMEPHGPEPAPPPVPPARQHQSLLRQAWSRLTRIATAHGAFWLIVFMISLALLSFAGVPLTPYSFDQTSSAILSPPSWSHPMGTDELGRDLLTRVIYGSRLSMSIGLVTALVASDHFKFNACRHVFNFLYGRDETTAEATVFDKCVDALTAQGTIQAALSAVAKDPSFCL